MARYSPKNVKEKTLKVSNSFGTAYTPTTKAAGSQHTCTHTDTHAGTTQSQRGGE